MIKAVIFDMDGVLIDSEIVYMYYFRDFVVENLKASIDMDVLEQGICKYIGKPDKDLLIWLSNQLANQYTIDELEEKSKEYWSKFSINYKTILNPHVANILPLLKQKGLTLSIASSSPLDNIKTVIRECEMEEYFDVIISGHDFKESKPNPEIYLKTLELLHVKAEEAVAIEDSTYGIEAAMRAGIKVIGIEDTRFGFDQSKATVLVKDMLQAYRTINLL